MAKPVRRTPHTVGSICGESSLSVGLVLGRAPYGGHRYRRSCCGRRPCVWRPSFCDGGRAKLELMNDSVYGRERLASFAQVDARQKTSL